MTKAITQAAERERRQEQRVALSLPRRSHHLPPLLFQSFLRGLTGLAKSARPDDAKAASKKRLAYPAKDGQLLPKMPAVHRAVSNIILCQGCPQKRALEAAMERAQQFQPQSFQNWREGEPYAKSPPVSSCTSPSESKPISDDMMAGSTFAHYAQRCNPKGASALLLFVCRSC